MSAPTDAPSGAVGRRLELRIAVACEDNGADLLVRASSSDRVGDLARSAANSLGYSGGQLTLWCARRSEPLLDPEELGTAGIRWGDRLLLGKAPREPTRVGGTARVAIVVSGGPCAGESFELGDGAY